MWNNNAAMCVKIGGRSASASLGFELESDADLVAAGVEVLAVD